MPKVKKTDTKRIEKQEERRLRNRAVRSTVRTFITRARAEIVADPEGEATQEAISRALRQLDKAAQKGVIHKNNAARRKSRLIKRARSAAATPAA